MEPHPSAPPLVAVVVTADPGEWFEESLAALENQDYPNQSVLVVDAGTRGDTPSRVAAVLPDAYLRRVDGSEGFGSVANDVLETVHGSSFLLFCHDDVALDPDAVRRLVEEALRSNAGVVGPKLVEWDRPERLLEVGLAVDKTGAATSRVEPGELDQEQHDAVRDVFAVSSTCMLLRSDLFTTLSGFDTVMDERGADIDLCWRAQVAGARVLVAPAARARHRGDGIAPAGSGGKDQQQARHHLRAMLKSYSFAHLLRVLPQAAVVTFVEALIAAFGRRWSDARQLVSAWPWNLRRLREIRPLRRRVQQLRAIPDSEVRRLQVRGSVRLSSYLRRRLHAEERAEALLSAGQHLVGEVKRGPTRAMAGLAALMALAVVVGSRDLLDGPLPSVGELAPLPRPSTLFSHFLNGWRTTGMGSQSPAPPAFGLLGLAGGVVLGNMEFLQKLLVFGAWPVGAAGAWRLARPMRSTMARLFAVVAYLAVPLPYNALARGHWSGLVAYAAAPWVLGVLVRRTELTPYAPYDDAGQDTDSDEPPRLAWGLACLRLGVPLALVLALAPSFGVALLLAAVGLLLATLLTGDLGRTPTAVWVAAGSIGVALLLLFPWSLDVLLPGRANTIFGVARLADRGYGLGALLRFEVGPMGAGLLGWVLLAVATLPLILGSGWRLAWAARFWSVALTCVVGAWAGGRGWLPLQLQSPDVLLAPAAAAIAAAAAICAVVFERDLPAYRFGWRQVAPLLAGLGLAAATLPVLTGAREGRWRLPDDEVAQSVAWMRAEAANGAFRVLWMGDPDVLPLPGWRLDDGVAYATSRNGPPAATDMFPGPASPSTQQIADALDVARRGDTSRLGRLLAPMAIRYIVVPTDLSISGDADDRLPLPTEFGRALESQLDLRVVTTDPSIAVYENTSWGPGRALLAADSEAARRIAPSASTQLSAGADLRGSQPVLTRGGPARFRGSLPAAGPVFVSETSSRRWALEVNGRSTPRQGALGVANVFQAPTAGRAELQFNTPAGRYLSIAVQVGAWAVALAALVRFRRRRRT